MKTDVIFLGAGASANAGFPLGEDLANYIKDKLPKRPLPDHASDLRRELTEVAKQLRQTDYSTVDAFVEKGKSDPGLTQKVKRMVRLALFDHSTNSPRGRREYDRFAKTLFKADELNLDERITVVNFNYDGLFGKLLADKVLARWKHEGIDILSRHDELAAYAGGYYSWPEGGQTSDAFCGLPARENDGFDHCMPHGTFIVVWKERKLISLLNLIYQEDSDIPCSRRTDECSRGELFLKTYSANTFIRFPWEENPSIDESFWRQFNCQRSVYLSQIIAVADAVAQAKRIHFIGLSGHRLLRDSLRRMFPKTSTPEALTGKEWHVATDRNPQAIFDRLMTCFLSEGTTHDADLRAKLRSNMIPYPSFEAWLQASPYRNL